jgi:hypothetical protein
VISFKKLGQLGRLGNQLFQYAFLRTTAERLGVKFYCPEWLGDRIFQLNDGSERTRECGPVNKEYKEGNNCGFVKSALRIKDGTEILGYFQSFRYFDRAKVGRWYTFKDDAIASIRTKYPHIDFTESTGIHLRFGDMKNLVKYMILSKEYYIRALSRTARHKNIVVFSDEIDTAKKYLKDIKENLVFLEGNKDYEELYLMTLCRDFICSISTFSWWGAWLNDFPDKIIVAPTKGLRPGYSVKSDDFCCRGWVPIRAYRNILDDYRFIIWKQRFLRAKKRSLAGNLQSLNNFLRNKIRLLRTN